MGTLSRYLAEKVRARSVANGFILYLLSLVVG